MRIKWTLPVVFCLVPWGFLCAQEPSCGQIASMARMARARSNTELIADELNAGKNYRAQVVFAALHFELDPANKHAAEALLILIPKDDAQHLVWMTFGDSLCDAEPIENMKSLGRLGERLSRDLARATLLVPEKMRAYVSYASTAVQDPHNDYAEQMRTVCRANHTGFTKAIEAMPEKDRTWFVGHIFNPVGCRTLAFPEAD